VLFPLIYLLLRRLVGLVGCSSNDLHNDIEIRTVYRGETPVS